MAEIEYGIVTYLKALGSPPAGGRIYPVFYPQNPTWPVVTYQRVSGVRIRGLGGPHGTSEARIQFDVWGQTYVQVKAVATALRHALDGYAGAMGTETVGGVVLETDRDLYEDDAKLHRASMDFMVQHVEA